MNRWTRITEYSSTNQTADRRFVWNGTTLEEERDASGSNVVKRFFGNGFTQTGTNYYYVKDQLGSIVEVTDGSGNIVARFSYDPYGKRTQTYGTLQVDYGFAGLFEHQSGIQFAVFRFKDGARWINRDPIKEQGGWNLYAYCQGNPVSDTDLEGLKVDLYIDTPNMPWWKQIGSAIGYNNLNAVDWNKTYGEGTFVIVAHGNKDKAGTFTDTAAMAKALYKLKSFKNASRVLLISCNTGVSQADGTSFAKKLATALHMEVWAPTGKISQNFLGNLVVSENGEVKQFKP